MALRIGIDMDGTVADLATAYHDVERALFGERPDTPTPDAEIEGDEIEQASDGRAAIKAAKQEARERDQVWQTIRHTEDFWLSLRPLEPGVVRRLHQLSVDNKWEVFFVTQRPRTAGNTVQRQTQEWLVREGFEMPSVLTLAGGRGRAAAALELNVLVDDYAKNCVDVVSESRCRPILVVRSPSETSEAGAKQLGITVCRSVAEALTLVEAPEALAQPGLMSRLFAKWRPTVDR